jgi:hypothetical protein
VGCANPIVAEEALVSGWWPSGLGEEAAAPLLASASGDRNGEAGLCYERMELEFGPYPRMAAKPVGLKNSIPSSAAGWRAPVQLACLSGA